MAVLSTEQRMSEQRGIAPTVMADLLFEEPGVGRCLVAPDGSVMRANAEWLRSTGCSLEQVVGADIVDLVPDTRDMALALHARAREGHRVEVPRHAQTIDGRETWWEGSIAPVPMEGGTGLLITAREITRGRHAASEQDLAQSRAHLEAALASMTDAVFISDAEGRFVEFNEAFATFHRFPSKEACAKTLAEYPAFLDVYLPDGTLAPLERWAVPRALRGETVTNAEYRLHRKDTGDRWIGSYSFAPIRDAAGRVVGSVVVGRDVTAQKSAEEALKTRDAQFRTLIEELHSGVALIDAGGRFTLYNRRFLELFGLSRDADIHNVNSQDWAAWQVYDDSGRVLGFDEHPVRKAAVNKQGVRNQLIAVRPPAGGDLRWLLVSAEPMLADDGTIEHIICTYHDITERKRAEQAQARHEELLTRLFERVPVMIALYDPALGQFQFNEELRRLLGWTEADAAAGDFMTLAYPDSAERAAATEHMTTLAPGWRELTITAKDGTSFPSAWANIRLTDDTQVGIGIDLRERKQAEAALRQSEERLRIALDAASFGTFDFDPATGTALWDAQMRRIWAMPPDQQIGYDTIRGRVHPDDRERTRRAFDAALGPAANGSFTAEYRIVWPDGSVHWCSTKGRVYFSGEGAQRRAVRVVGVDADITERKEAEERVRDANERLREADRRKDEFLGMLSHELRNPLAPIRNSIYILRHTDAASEQAVRARSIIERQTEHLTRLVDDLLDVTRIARGKIELRRSRIDLREVVARAADDFRLLLHDRGVTFDVALPDAQLWADADATRITQIIGNLLHNASKFTKHGDKVVLTVAAAGDAAEIRLRDTGAGIDPRLLPTVFDPFVQGERTLARTEGGLGLGLALVKGIAELHGGSVRAESAGEGQGAELMVRLPLAPRAVTDERPSAAEDRPSGGRRVLVVDDNFDAAESLADIARVLGNTVDVAYDGASAIEKARQSPPDVVLCDIGLPGMSGYDVARALRAMAIPMQLYAVTGYAQPEDIKTAARAGFDGHIAKPADPAKIERLLAR